MWEAIRANRRRSILLIALMGLVLITLGAAIGLYAGTEFSRLQFRPSGDEPLQGGLLGGAAAGLLWLVLWLVAVYQGDQVLLRSAHAREIRKVDHPRLWNIVEEMTIAAGLPNMPRIYLIADTNPNAFAVGRTPEKAAVAVTSGLLRLLDRDELQGVIAHELGHIRNFDIRFMTIAAVLVASVEIISRGFLHGGARSGRALSASGSGGGGGGGKGSGKGFPAPLLAIVVVLIVLSPILVRLLYLATSRWREYLADASAARFTRYPEGLASALEKITAWHSQSVPPDTSEALAALCIVNPVERLLSSLYSTHPPTEKRIKILRSMGGRAGYVDYEAALQKIESANIRLAALDAAAHAEGSIAARTASGGVEGVESDIDRARQVGDLVDRLANYVVVPCTCGMRIKLPPEAKLDRVECPRCGLWHQVPAAEPDPAPDNAAAPEPAALPLIAQGENTSWHYERRDAGWESFRCVCGQTIQLGPEYPLDYTVCANCNRRIDLKNRPATAPAA